MLRYFQYSPPAGGFGGDFDLLYAQASFIDDADLERILAALGYRGVLPLAEARMDIGVLTLCDAKVLISVGGQARYPGAERLNRIGFTAGVYVTELQLKEAQRIEDWLDALNIPMLSV